LGGWTRDRLSYLAMVVKITRGISAATKFPQTAQPGDATDIEYYRAFNSSRGMLPMSAIGETPQGP
jgi:hypothetical protein